MKNLLITLFLVCITAGLQAQITIPKDTVWERVETITVNIDTFNINMLGTVTNDSVVYETTAYPHFVTVDVVDNVWEQISYKNDTMVGEYLYRPLNRKLFKIMASGRIIISQQADKLQRVVREKPRDYQFWYYLKQSKRTECNTNSMDNLPGSRYAD